MLIGFGALAVVAAVGFELRTRSDELNVASDLLLMLNALVLAWAGWAVLPDAAGTSGSPGSRSLTSRSRRPATGSPGCRMRSCSGRPGSASCSPTSRSPRSSTACRWWPAGRAAPSRSPRSPARAKRTVDSEFALAGLGGHLGLALAHTLVYEAPLSSVGGGPDLAAGAALALVAAGCFASARLAPAGLDPLARLALDAIALALVGYLGAVHARGPGADARVGRRGGRRSRRSPAATATALARAGSLAFLGCAAVHALAILAPASALVVGLDDPLPRWRCSASPARRWPPRACPRSTGSRSRRWRRWSRSTWLRSSSSPRSSPIVRAAASRARRPSERLWALVGVAALVAGLLLRPPRSSAARRARAAAVTLAKVFLYDLSSLDSMYRVASFVALGLLLLVGAFAWQRSAAPAYPVQVTPDHDPDLRRAESLDEELLEAETVAILAELTDAPRLERIHEELRTGFAALAHVGKAVSIFGSARTPPRPPAATSTRARAGAQARRGGLRDHHRRRAGDHGGGQPRRAGGRRRRRSGSTSSCPHEQSHERVRRPRR